MVSVTSKYKLVFNLGDMFYDSSEYIMDLFVGKPLNFTHSEFVFDIFKCLPYVTGAEVSDVLPIHMAIVALLLHLTFL